MKLAFLKRNIVTIALIILVLATSHTQIVQAIDLIQDGHIIFTGPSPEGAKDIRTSTNDGGLRFYNGNGTLANPPEGAAIQFFGNDRGTFNGQAFIDSGAHANAALIFRTAPASTGLTERMRITAQGGIALGTGALASRFQEKATANGSFAVPGDAQTSTFVLRGALPVTSGVTALTLDGGTQQITIPEDHTMSFEVRGIFLGSAGDSSHVSCQGSIENVGGTTSIVGSPVLCIGFAGDVGAAVFFSVTADDTNDILVVSANNLSATETFRVVAGVRTVEVGNPIP
jgi:hypothetical protein